MDHPQFSRSGHAGRSQTYHIESTRPHRGTAAVRLLGTGRQEALGRQHILLVIKAMKAAAELQIPLQAGFQDIAPPIIFY